MTKERRAAIDRENKALAEMRRREEMPDLELEEDLKVVEGLHFLLDRILPKRDIDITPQLQPIMDKLVEIDTKLDQINTRMVSIESGIARFDRIGLRAWNQIVAMKEVATAIEPEVKPEPTKDRKRISKSEVKEKCLEAARLLLEEGQTITLRAVAELTGYKYAQVTYAWKTQELRDAAARE